MKLNNRDYREEMTAKIVEALEKGKAPWQKTWIDTIPVNAVTGNYYQGINSIILSVEGEKLSGDGDPRWATKKQAESQGWTIKKGAEATTIRVIILRDKKVMLPDIYAQSESFRRKKPPIQKTFEVYHASQIQGIPSFVKPKNKPVISNEVLDKIVFYSSARVFEGGNEAYYSPRDDFIRMPYRSAFIDTESYYSTLLHELAHWTGHSSRLNRFFSWSLRKNSEAYAREELTAEIASMFLTAATGIRQTQEHFNNHMGYIASWISLLKSDPNAIFKAAQDARKAAEFIMSFRDEETSKVKAAS